MGVNDLQAVEYDGERTVSLVFTRDGHEARFPIKFAMPVYRDIYIDGKTYEAGDVVTWGGAMWIAKSETSAKPGLNTPESRAWRLCVKAGRDGKQGPQGKEGPSGPRGPQGDRGPERW